MLEKHLQAKSIKKFLQAGCLAVKVDASRPGWPDVTVVLPGGGVWFVEFKTPTGRLSPHQVKVHAQLQERGATVYVIRTTEEVDALIARSIAHAAERD